MDVTYVHAAVIARSRQRDNVEDRPTNDRFSSELARSATSQFQRARRHRRLRCSV